MEYIAISGERTRAVTINSKRLNTNIIAPIENPNLLFRKSPRISAPSNTEPFLIAKPIPVPKKIPPNVAMINLSSVMGSKFSK